MTYQYITLQMVQNSKKNGGFIDQTAFKTEHQYAFDTLILSQDVLQVLDSYIDVVRPRLKPACNYLLLTTNGNQYTALGTAMSLLVHQAIDKYVNPTRYRQIIESQSAQCLTPEEMNAVSKDQKHSSYVARRIYQKQLSRDVAAQGKTCMEKIVGKEREEHTKQMADIVSELTTPASPAMEDGAEDEIEPNDNNTTVINVEDVEEVMSIMNATSLSPKEETEILDCDEQNSNSSSIASGTTDDVITCGGTVITITDAKTDSVRTLPVSMSTSSTTPETAIQNEDIDVEVKKELVKNEVSWTPIQKNILFSRRQGTESRN